MWNTKFFPEFQEEEGSDQISSYCSEGSEIRVIKTDARNLEQQGIN